MVKRLFLAAKCESGEDWVTICLIASNQTVIVSRLANFISFSKVLEQRKKKGEKKMF